MGAIICPLKRAPFACLFGGADPRRQQATQPNGDAERQSLISAPSWPREWGARSSRLIVVSAALKCERAPASSWAAFVSTASAAVERRLVVLVATAAAESPPTKPARSVGALTFDLIPASRLLMRAALQQSLSVVLTQIENLRQQAGPLRVVAMLSLLVVFRGPFCWGRRKTGAARDGPESGPDYRARACVCGA
jgi:hypothetical protein